MKLLLLTSLIFFTNFLHNTWNKQFIYAWLFLLLTITSVFIHSKIFEKDSLNNEIIILDKIIILSIFFYGFYLYWKSSNSIYPVLSFISVCLIYSQIYDKENNFASHGCMHIIGSLGHHLIIYDYGIYMDIKRKMNSIFSFIQKKE
jgi:hypothetical protein